MSARTVSTKRADELAEQTRDAYSFDAFGKASWRASCRMLARRGFDESAIVEIMRSKWTRWCRDANGTYRGTSAALARYLDSSGITRANWKKHMGLE